MHEFLAAQLADPSDPAPTLIHADRAEECGDKGLADFLRGLAAAGLSSLDFFLIQGACDAPYLPDVFDERRETAGCGNGQGDGIVRSGYGAAEGEDHGHHHGAGAGGREACPLFLFPQDLDRWRPPEEHG